MTLIIQKPTGAKVNLAKTYVGIDDPDAAAYITAVEAADTTAGQTGGLETATKVAIHSFVKGCKADGIWPAIKASCILSGARTLSGALVPLVGTAPTNGGGLFTSSDYNRKTGLKGGSSRRLTTAGIYQTGNPKRHAYAFIKEAATGNNFDAILGAQTSAGEILKNNSPSSFLMRPWGGSSARNLTNGIGGVGISRAEQSQGIQYTTTTGANTVTEAFEEVAPLTITIFARNATGTGSTDPRIAFFSGGEFLDLALLDARVTTLINAFAAAIP
jgi:hypothetical protein